MELSTALVWALRILLPIILFCVYFKLQKGLEEPFRGPTDRVRTRDEILAHRKVVRHAPTPASKIVTKSASEAPSLFPANGGRGGRSSRRHGDAPRERREKRKNEVQPECSENVVDASQELDAKVENIAEQDPTTQKMNVESLLNYVAFTRKEQQRVFLPDTSGVPPPPPPAKKAAAAADEDRDKANADAQLVLRGAIDLKRSDVAMNLYEQLHEAQVELAAETFVLLIQACIRGNDLKGASDFLLKMETSGHFPDSELLDMVMELYSRQKGQKDNSKDAKELKEKIEAEGARTKLCSHAAVFVPTFIPPPPLVPPYELPVAEPSEDLVRTKLTAAAKPFEPKFADDVSMPLWNGDAPEETYREEDHDYYEWPEWNQSKGKGKGKGKGKSKSRGNNGDSWWQEFSDDSKWHEDSRWKEHQDDSWWKDKNGDSRWKEKHWETEKNGSARKNNDHKHSKTATDTKKSGGLVWKPKATSKEEDS